MKSFRAVALCFAAALLAAATGVSAAETKPPSDCVTCHVKTGITGSALRDFSMSKHAAQGMSCDDCHLKGDVTKKTSACEKPGVVTSVSARVCAECHGEQVAQFEKGKHSKAWLALTAMPTTKDQPKTMMDGMKGCGGCHKIGLKSTEEISTLSKDGHAFGVAGRERPRLVVRRQDARREAAEESHHGEIDLAVSAI